MSHVRGSIADLDHSLETRLSRFCLEDLFNSNPGPNITESNLCPGCNGALFIDNGRRSVSSYRYIPFPQILPWMTRPFAIEFLLRYNSTKENGTTVIISKLPSGQEMVIGVNNSDGVMFMRAGSLVSFLPPIELGKAHYVYFEFDPKTNGYMAITVDDNTYNLSVPLGAPSLYNTDSFSIGKSETTAIDFEIDMLATYNKTLTVDEILRHRCASSPIRTDCKDCPPPQPDGFFCVEGIWLSNGLNTSSPGSLLLNSHSFCLLKALGVISLPSGSYNISGNVTVDANSALNISSSLVNIDGSLSIGSNFTLSLSTVTVEGLFYLF